MDIKIDNSLGFHVSLDSIKASKIVSSENLQVRDVAIDRNYSFFDFSIELDDETKDNYLKPRALQDIFKVYDKSFYTLDKVESDTLYSTLMTQDIKTTTSVSNIKIHVPKQSFAVSPSIRMMNKFESNNELVSMENKEEWAKVDTWKEFAATLKEEFGGIQKWKDLSTEVGHFTLNAFKDVLVSWLNDASVDDFLNDTYKSQRSAKTGAEALEKSLKTEYVIHTPLSALSEVSAMHNPVWTLVNQKQDLMSNMYDVSIVQTILNSPRDRTSAHSEETSSKIDEIADIVSVRAHGFEIPNKKQSTFEWSLPTGTMHKVESNMSYERTLEITLDLDQPLYVYDFINGACANVQCYSQSDHFSVINSEVEKLKNPEAGYLNLKEAFSRIPMVYQKLKSNKRFDLRIRVLNNYDDYLNHKIQKLKKPYTDEPAKVGTIFYFEDVRVLGTTDGPTFDRENDGQQSITVKLIYKALWKNAWPEKGK